MRTLRLALAGTVMLTLLGGSGGAVMAQGDSEAPGSGDSTMLSFTIGHGGTTSGPIVGEEDGRTTYRDHRFESPINTNDPRLTGELWSLLNYDFFHDSSMYLGSGVTGIDNDDGSWRGTALTYSTPGDVRVYQVWDLTGEGAYEGLSARMFWVPDGGRYAVEGIIFDGEPPPFPDLPAE